MSGGKQDPGGPDDPKRGGGGASGQEDDNLVSAKLFAGLRSVAREQADDLAKVPAELTAPPSEGERNAILRAIAGSDAPWPDSSGAGTAVGPAIPSVRPSRPWSIRRFALVGSFVAAAAVTLLLVQSRGVHAPPLPGYSMALSGDLKEFRGPNRNPAQGSDSIPRADARSEIVLVCRPDVAVQGPIASRAFLIQGQSVREISTRTQTSATGSLEIRFNPVKDAAAEPGQWSLRVAVGRPDRVHDLASSAAFGAVDDKEVTWLKGELEVIHD